MADCSVDLQGSVIFEITHSSIYSYRLRLQRVVNFWLLRQLLSSEAPSNLPPPFFAQNYHLAQPTVMFVGIGSDLIEVSISDCWDSYYRPTKSWLIFHPLILRGIIVRHNPQFYQLVQAQISPRCQLLIFQTFIIYQILPLSSTPYFCAELSSGTTCSYVRWNSLIVQRAVNC